MDYFTDWLTGKQRAKKDGNVQQTSKDSSPPPSSSPQQVQLQSGSTTTIDSSTSSPLQESTGQTRLSPSHSNPLTTSHLSSTSNANWIYLQPEFAVFTRSFAESNIHELIRQPSGVDKNEWIANNIVAFFNHVNALYNAISDVCTPLTCPTMIGPQNSSYSWIDERNKKIKCSAPQYIELSLIFIQKSLSDENIFPTRLDHQFPSYFDSLVRKMVRLLFHCVAHLYAVHYRQLIELQLNPHLNSFFLHFVSFLITSNIISSDNSTVNTPSISTLNLPGPSEARELRTELETLVGLYQLLSDQWRHAYAQASAMKRKSNYHQ